MQKYVGSQLVIINSPPSHPLSRIEGLALPQAVRMISRQRDQDTCPFPSEQAASVINVRWFNSKTHEYSWEDPKIKSHWKTITEDGETQPYYYNIVTGASQWDLPDELAWSKHEHEDSFFWFNKETGENTW